MARKSGSEAQAADADRRYRRTKSSFVRTVRRMHVARQIIGKVSQHLEARLHGVLSALGAMHTRVAHDEAEDLVQLIDAATLSLHQAALLSRQLRAVSEPRTSKPGPVNVNAVITTMTVLLRSMVGFKVDIEFGLGSNLPNVVCDPGHLEYVLFKLALDARDSIVGRGRVIIETSCITDRDGGSASHERAFLQICVVDTGEVQHAPAMASASSRQARAAHRSEVRTSVELARQFAAGLRGRVVVDRHPEAGTAIMILLPFQREDYGKRIPVAGVYDACVSGGHEIPAYSAIPPLLDRGSRTLHR